MAPLTFQVTALKKHGGSGTGAVVNGKTLDVENHSLRHGFTILS
jgi:hypothetical protein